MEKIDVVVIGAGVVGLAVARALALSGREVVVLEAASAIGTGTLRYQWRFNGDNIPAGTNSLLVLTNVSLANQGRYDCALGDDFDTTTSQVVTLTLVSRPAFALQPLSQSAVAGRSVTFSVSALGTTPMGFRWRRPATITNGLFNGWIVIGPDYSSLTLTNLLASDSTNYTVAVTNIAGTATGGQNSGGLSSNAFLTVLIDTDMDGLPDEYQAAHPGVTGGGDEDHDGMINAAEYFAGTDPFDATSNLKLTVADLAGGLQFRAVSNRTYTVQYTDGLNPIQWKKLADVLGKNVTRIETVTDPAPRANRLYRIVTPLQP